MNPMTDWWTLAMRCSDIAFQAPTVMQQRMALLSASKGKLSVATQRETSRMVTEKLQAAGEMQWVMWQNVLTMQQQWLRGWMSTQSAATPAGRRSAAAIAWHRTARSAPGMAARALAPMQRRVTANAKRLGSKKRR